MQMVRDDALATMTALFYNRIHANNKTLCLLFDQNQNISVYGTMKSSYDDYYYSESQIQLP